MILIIRTRATPQQIEQMLEELKFYIKLAVDVDPPLAAALRYRHILAGGGEMHADCEEVLLKDGSSQRNIWGAGFMPSNQKMTFDSLINIRPRQNREMEITDDRIRERVARVITDLLGGI